MARVKRSRARIVGQARARQVAARVGLEVRASRRRRRLKQATLAARAGISQARLAEIEAGQGGGAPLEVWLALAEALGRFLKFEFGRDPQAELADAGHLAIQERVIRLARAAGWDVSFEAESRAWGVGRSIVVRLIDRRSRQIVIVECWNTSGNLGEAARSSHSKVAQAQQQAVAIAGDGPPYDVGLVWVARDTKANRELVARYGHVFDAWLPGSSGGWIGALTVAGARIPARPGLFWCDVQATRLFARRRSGAAR